MDYLDVCIMFIIIGVKRAKCEVCEQAFVSQTVSLYLLIVLNFLIYHSMIYLFRMKE